MNRTLVRSSKIRSVSYDPASLTLEVESHSGSIYQYSGVPEPISQDLMHASSKGSCFQDHIKGHYANRQVR